ncbi:MAG: exo-alpha-sialidase [Deltaproteobacteria bacterium]|nr:exo-alpha-sialidase [Deltaproteobacteria bacterium]
MRAAALLLGIIACGGPSARPQIEWEPPRSLATGGGERGPWQQNNSRFDHVDDPSVVLAPDGAALIAWVDHRTKDVLFQIVERDGAQRRTRPTNVSRTPAVFSWLPRLALDGDVIHVLWQEIVFSGGSHGGDIFYARSRDGGVTFEDARNLSASLAGDGKGRIDAKTWNNGSLDLAVDSRGVHAAWTEYEGRLWLARSIDGGDTFAAPALIAGDATHPARAPALALSAIGVHLAWTTGEDASADVRVVTSRDGVTFSDPVVVAPTRTYSDAPKLAVDERGTLHLAFAESAAGPHDRFDVHYTRSRDGGQTFEPSRTLSRPHPGGAESAAFPSLAISGATLHVAWELYPDHREAPRGLAHAISRDGGDTFSPPSLVPGSSDPLGGGNGSFQGRLMRKLAVRGDQVAMVNSSLALGQSSRVWLVRGRLAAHPR